MICTKSGIIHAGKKKNITDLWFLKIVLKWCLSFVPRPSWSLIALPNKSRYLFALLHISILHENSRWWNLTPRQVFTKHEYICRVCTTEHIKKEIVYMSSASTTVTAIVWHTVFRHYGVRFFLVLAPSCFHKCHVCWKTVHIFLSLHVTYPVGTLKKK